MSARPSSRRLTKQVARILGAWRPRVNEISVARAGGREPVSLAAHGLGDVAVLRDVLQVLGVYARQDVDRGRNRRARVAREVENNRVGARPGAVQGDDAQHLVGDRPHRGDAFDLLVRDARVVYDGLGHDLVGVAYEDGAG